MTYHHRGLWLWFMGNIAVLQLMLLRLGKETHRTLEKTPHSEMS